MKISQDVGLASYNCLAASHQWQWSQESSWPMGGKRGWQTNSGTHSESHRQISNIFQDQHWHTNIYISNGVNLKLTLNNKAMCKNQYMSSTWYVNKGIIKRFSNSSKSLKYYICLFFCSKSLKLFIPFENSLTIFTRRKKDPIVLFRFNYIDYVDLFY